MVNLANQKNDPRLIDMRFDLASTAVLTRQGSGSGEGEGHGFSAASGSGYGARSRSGQGQGQGQGSGSGSADHSCADTRAPALRRAVHTWHGMAWGIHGYGLDVVLVVITQAIKELNISNCEIEHLPDQARVRVSVRARATANLTLS